MRLLMGAVAAIFLAVWGVGIVVLATMISDEADRVDREWRWDAQMRGLLNGPAYAASYGGVSEERKYPNMHEINLDGKTMYCTRVIGAMDFEEVNGEKRSIIKVTFYDRNGTVTVPYDLSRGTLFNEPRDLRTPEQKNADSWALMDKTGINVLVAWLVVGLVAIMGSVVVTVVKSRGKAQRAAGPVSPQAPAAHPPSQ